MAFTRAPFCCSFNIFVLASTYRPSLGETAPALAVMSLLMGGVWAVCDGKDMWRGWVCGSRLEEGSSL